MFISAIVTVDPLGNTSAVYFLDGHEISAREYDIVQMADMDRYFADSDNELG